MGCQRNKEVLERRKQCSIIKMDQHLSQTYTNYQNLFKSDKVQENVGKILLTKATVFIQKLWYKTHGFYR